MGHLSRVIKNSLRKIKLTIVGSGYIAVVQKVLRLCLEFVVLNATGA
jgi:hypothetical protein